MCYEWVLNTYPGHLKEQIWKNSDSHCIEITWYTSGFKCLESAFNHWNIPLELPFSFSSDSHKHILFHDHFPVPIYVDCGVIICTC